MKNMRLKIAIGSALFVVLWTAQTALAWYDPSTGQWLSRDPIGEPGFQVSQAAAHPPATPVPSSAQSRWLSREPIGESGELNEYSFVGGDSINVFDYLGLAGYKFDDMGWKYAPRADMQRGLHGETQTDVYEIGSECKKTKECWQPRFTFKVKTESRILTKMILHGVFQGLAS